jgi:8-oxo-dGTP pyrophosphatase MutT (NUDIX family)
MGISGDIIKKKQEIYHVSMKVLLREKDKVLFLYDSDENNLDLPGGRIDDTEQDVPLSEIIKREVEEELGAEIKYKLGNPAFQFRRYFKDDDLHIFITVYEAEFLSGEIKLSSEHGHYEWMDLKNLELEKINFFSEEEYSAFKNYLDGISV